MTPREIRDAQLRQNLQVALARRLQDGQSLGEALACIVTIAYGAGKKAGQSTNG